MTEEHDGSSDDQFLTTVKEHIDKIRKDAEDIYLSEIQALREEINHIHASLQETSPARLTDNAFIYRFSEELKSTKEILEELKEQDIEVNETSLVLSGYLGLPTEETHRFFQLATRDKIKYSPFARNISNINRSATLISPPLIDLPYEKADILVNNEFRRNKFKKMLRGWVSNCFDDGEIFICMYTRTDGTVKFRVLDSQEIPGIEYHPDDKHVILSFHRSYTKESGEVVDIHYPHVDYFEQKEDEVDGAESSKDSELEPTKLVFYFRYGFRDGERGNIPLMPVLRYDRLYEDILLDLARLYHERARVVWIKRLIGSNQQTGFDRTTKPSRGGTIKIETDNIRWRIENSRLSEHTSREYGRVHRLAICSGVGMPEAFVFQDSSNQSYASLRKADTPFQLLINDNQTFWSENIEEIVRAMLRHFVESGLLDEVIEIERIPQDRVLEVYAKVTEMLQEGKKVEEISIEETEKEKIAVKTVDIPISITFPKQPAENPLIQAQALEVLRRAGLISRRTGIKQAGLDSERELYLMDLEGPVAEPAQSMKPPEDNKNKTKNSARSQTQDDNYDGKLGRGTA